MTEKKPHLTYAQAALVIARMKTEVPAGVPEADRIAQAKLIITDVLAQPTPSSPAATTRMVNHYQDSVYG